MIWQRSASRIKASRRSFYAWKNRELCALPSPSESRSNVAGMSDLHLAYLSLGSNIQPETNLVRAIERLGQYGRLEKISSAWESQSVGADGPNYLNACVLLVTPLART